MSAAKARRKDATRGLTPRCIFGLWAVLLGFAGCGSVTHSVVPESSGSVSKSPADLWAESGITSYLMTYTSTCGDGAWISMDPVTVQVDGGDVERVSGDTPGKLATVASIFGLIDAARAGGANSVEASYGRWGEPATVEIVYSDALDNQLCFDISGFEPA